VTVTLRLAPQGDGVGENETQEGNEESVSTVTDALLLGELSHAFRSKVKISQQRVPWNLGEANVDALSDWWAIRMDRIFFNQLCSNELVTSGKHTGWNTINAASTGRILRAAGRANAGALTSADVMNLTLIDQAVELAKTSEPFIRPVRIDGDEMYVLFLDPAQVTSLRTNTATGQWQDIQKAAMMGGKVADSPIFKGSLGIYNNVILHECSGGGVQEKLCQGINAGAYVVNTRRAVLCGAQALVVGYGQGYGPEQWEVNEETFDYGRQIGTNGLCVFGMKATRFNDRLGTTRDFGKIVLETFAQRQ
jgi:N4-gp56 family major capsid protein